VLTWDEAKRQANIAKHGYDFVGAEAILDHPVVTWEDDREDYGEQRINMLGWLHGRVMHLTYTDDDEALHVISRREATPHETRDYFKSISF
jgi:uncharacterized DUF497 family protein